MKQDIEQDFLAAYDQYADALYKHCFFRVYSAERAQDLVQETFMKTWDFLRQGKKIENFRAFLYKVMNNLIIDNSRKRKEMSLDAILEEDASLEPMDEHTASPELSTFTRQVFDSLEQMPEDMRQVLLLRYVDDLDPKEIGPILGITPNHASVKLNRAMQLLRKMSHN